uniref:Putative portal protein n=1 Tax=viral metagenome TaxID=1070528 RepID=A0A6H1ZMI4_9ZZZZ
MADDNTYLTGLAGFIDKSISAWAEQKEKFLEPKFKRNYQAVTNRDYRVKAWKKDEGKEWRSTTWIGFVRVKVWAFYALLLDTVLKAGKIPFSLEPSPYDEHIKDEAMIQDRDARLERMKDKIEGQLSSRQADRQYMKKWLSGAYYGMAFSKFNVEPVESTEFQQVDMGLGDAAQYMAPEELAQYTRFELVKNEEDTPGHRYVSVWNMVWDMEGDGLQPKDSSGYAEFVPSSAFDLKQLKGEPGYIDDAIERVIANKLHEGPGESGSNDLEEFPGKADMQNRKQKYKRFEFHMRAPRLLVEEFETLIRSGGIEEVPTIGLIGDYEEAEEGGDDIEIMGEIVDKEIIRFIRNDSGRRPHHLWVVEQNLDETTGTGIADNSEDTQSSLVGMIRAFEDNKKLSANVTSAVKARFFNNPDQLESIKPGTKLDIADSCDDVRKAIMPIVFPDVGDTLITGIGMMRELNDAVTMIPTIMQGFTLPKHAPDTAYEMRQLTENAGKYIGQAIRNNDEQFIEPEIKDIYEYNMLYGEDEACKVNCKVKANGFTSFQNKEIRGERMRMALAMMLSSEILLPYAKIKPHLDVLYGSMDEDPDKYINSEEEIQAINQQNAEQQAMAEQKAIQTIAAQAELEASLKMAEGAAEHTQNVEKATVDHAIKTEEIDQEHRNTMKEEILKAKLDAIYDYGQPKKPMEAQNVNQ